MVTAVGIAFVAVTTLGIFMGLMNGWGLPLLTEKHHLPRWMGVGPDGGMEPLCGAKSHYRDRLVKGRNRRTCRRCWKLYEEAKESDPAVAEMWADIHRGRLARQGQGDPMEVVAL
jgi:hypothetical protein